jgi:1-acyl-sn-glycerol-3-phosphate acyltransferase
MLYRFAKLTAGPPIRLLIRPRVEGAERIPSDGAAILAVNHLSFCDPFLLCLLLRREVSFFAKNSNGGGSRSAHWIATRLLPRTGQLLVDRSGSPAATRRAVGLGGDILVQGGLLGVFPEGTRSPDGRLYRGRTGGVAYLALTHGVPVIPIGLTGTDRVMPIGKLMPRVVPADARPVIRIGQPLEFAELRGGSGDPAILRSVTDTVMERIAELSGQTCVDVDAMTAKRLAVTRPGSCR